MYPHTVSVNNISIIVHTPTHVDDHPSHEDWIEKSFAYIKAAANISSIVSVVLTHKAIRK